MLTSIDVNVSSSSIALLSESLEDKWMFSSANILQVADVVRRVVFLLFLAVCLIVLRETSEISRHFVMFWQTNSTSKRLPNLVIVNGLQGIILGTVSPLEAEEYFEWIIIADIVTLLGRFRQPSLAAIGVERRLHL